MLKVKDKRHYSLRNNNQDPNVVGSGWVHVLTFNKGTWEKETEESWIYKSPSVMIPAHLFFRTKKDFIDWLGEEHASEMFAHLV